MTKPKLIPIKRDNALLYESRKLATGANIHNLFAKMIKVAREKEKNYG